MLYHCPLPAANLLKYPFLAAAKLRPLAKQDAQHIFLSPVKQVFIRRKQVVQDLTGNQGRTADGLIAALCDVTAMECLYVNRNKRSSQLNAHPNGYVL